VTEGEESASFWAVDRRCLSWMAKIRSGPGILLVALGKNSQGQLPANPGAAYSPELQIWLLAAEDVCKARGSPVSGIFPQMFILSSLFL